VADDLGVQDNANVERGGDWFYISGVSGVEEGEVKEGEDVTVGQEEAVDQHNNEMEDINEHCDNCLVTRSTVSMMSGRIVSNS